MVRVATGGAPSGVLVVDKPSGPTSHDIVSRARRLFGTRAVGHAGTLDPMATGVLLLLFGEATKLSSYLTLETKTYRAEVRFGSGTDTLDAMGRVLFCAPIVEGSLAPDRIEAALARERARTEQTPPAVSAISVGGRRAHELVRRGEAPELEPRKVSVLALELLERHEDRLRLELTVSKGYYVRALARDLGEALGLPAHLGELRRTRSGGFSIEEAVPWPPPEGARPMPLVHAARRALPCAELTAEGVARARVGKALGAQHFVVPPPTAGPSAWLAESGELVALGGFEAGSGEHRVLRGIAAGA